MEKMPEAINILGIKTNNVNKSVENSSVNTEDLMRIFANLMIDRIISDKEKCLKPYIELSKI